MRRSSLYREPEPTTLVVSRSSLVVSISRCVFPGVGLNSSWVIQASVLLDILEHNVVGRCRAPSIAASLETKSIDA